MLNDDICELRDKLNKAIEENKEYDEIYKLSIQLDELIAKYYITVDSEKSYAIK